MWQCFSLLYTNSNEELEGNNEYLPNTLTARAGPGRARRDPGRGPPLRRAPESAECGERERNIELRGSERRRRLRGALYNTI